MFTDKHSADSVMSLAPHIVSLKYTDLVSKQGPSTYSNAPSFVRTSLAGSFTSFYPSFLNPCLSLYSPSFDQCPTRQPRIWELSSSSVNLSPKNKFTSEKMQWFDYPLPKPSSDGTCIVGRTAARGGEGSCVC